MKKQQSTYKERFVEYIRRTRKNKLCALALLTIGAVWTKISNDLTVLILLATISIPVFLANENCIS